MQDFKDGDVITLTPASFNGTYSIYLRKDNVTKDVKFTVLKVTKEDLECIYANGKPFIESPRRVLYIRFKDVATKTSAEAYSFLIALKGETNAPSNTSSHTSNNITSI